jgi:hypothetical protein
MREQYVLSLVDTEEKSVDVNDDTHARLSQAMQYCRAHTYKMNMIGNEKYV